MKCKFCGREDLVLEDQNEIIVRSVQRRNVPTVSYGACPKCARRVAVVIDELTNF